MLASSSNGQILLAGEFNSCKENGQLSETLRVISEATHLTQTECVPYPVVNSNISLDKAIPTKIREMP